MPPVDDLSLDQIVVSYLRAVDAGQPPSLASLQEKYPQQRDELAEFFADQDRLEKWTAGLRTVQSTTLPTDDATIALPQAAGGTMHSAPTAQNVGDRPATPVPGRFGDYELHEELARGGMGVVYRARQISLNRVVALKMILAGQFATAEDVRRFHAEAEAAALLHHPNIVPIHEVGEHLGQHFFTMQLIDGGSLSQRIAEFSLPLLDGGHRDLAGKSWSSGDIRQRQRNIARLMATVARAVHHAHQHGILHRDLKPGNILVDSGGVPHVTDFGLAKQIRKEEPGAAKENRPLAELGSPNPGTQQPEPLTRTGAIVGTPSYMAPEQAAARKSLTTAVDTYSLGAILYELLAGRPPFISTTPMETLLQVLTLEASRPSSLNPQANRDLETICLKCLEKEPEQRYASTEMLANDLERWLADEPILARRAGRLERAHKWARRRPAAAALLTVSFASLLVLLVLGGFLWQNLAARAQMVESLDKAALELSDKRNEVQHLSTLSDQETARAAAARKEAGDIERISGHLIYSADLQVARAAWDNNDVPRMLDVLKAYDPSSPNLPAKFQNLAGFEWRYLWSLPHASRLSWKAHKFAATGLPFLFRQADPDDLESFDDTTPFLVAVSPDGSMIASCAQGEVELWDLATGKSTKKLAGPKTAVSLAFSADGKKLLQAAGSQDKKKQDEIFAVMPSILAGKVEPGLDLMNRFFELHELDLETGTGRQVPFDIRRVETMSFIEMMMAGNMVMFVVPLENKRLFMAMSTAVSPDRKLLAMGGLVTETTADDPSKPPLQNFTLLLWDLEANKEKLLHKHPLGIITSLAFSADGRTLAMSGVDNEIRLWDMNGFKELPPLRGHSTMVVRTVFPRLAGKNGAAWFVRGNVKARGDDLLLSAGEEIRLWKLSTREVIAEFKGHQNMVNNLALTADGKSLVAGSVDGIIKVWDPQRSQGPTSLKAESPVLALGLAAGPAGKRQVVHLDGGGKVRIADAVSGKELKLWSTEQKKLSDNNRLAGQEHACISADGRVLALLGTFGKVPQQSVRIFDAGTGRLRRTIEGVLQSQVLLALSGNGARLAMTTGEHDRPHSLRLWDLDSGKEQVLEPELPGRATNLALSPDGQTLALSLDHGKAKSEHGIELWDLRSGKKSHFLRSKLRASNQLAFSQGGNLLAAGTGKDIVCWDTSTGQEVFARRTQLDRVTALAFTPDGTRLIAAESSESGRGANVNFWDLATGRLLVTLDRSSVSSHISHLTMSQDGDCLTAVFASEPAFILGGTPKPAEVRIWHGNR